MDVRDLGQQQAERGETDVNCEDNGAGHETSKYFINCCRHLPLPSWPL